MELSRIEIKDFKKIKSFKEDLKNLNVLVGANGSGKSSIIQAIHFASCLMMNADSKPEGWKSLDVAKLNYLPTNEYRKLGNEDEWQINKRFKSSSVRFSFSDGSANHHLSVDKIRAAKNFGISFDWISSDKKIISLFNSGNDLFSAYTPGISGITNSEEKRSKRVVVKACSFGDSNVYIRNALHLLHTEDKGHIKQIEEWLAVFLGKVKFEIVFDDEKDTHIAVNVEIHGEKIPKAKIPMELLGTGYIQLIQIFCYILLFKPKILLMDEPDVHLHPDVQERLPGLLENIANEQGLKIIMTTHSPFIVRGTPKSANIFWLDSGKVQKKNIEALKLSMGWGGLGKKVIISTEDKKIGLLKKIISQWPELERNTCIIPGKGCSNLMNPEQAGELHEAFEGISEILIHIDRDSMTKAEVRELKKQYKDKKVHLWVTEDSDIEAYFCSPPVVESLSGIPQNQIKTAIKSIINDLHQEIYKGFEGQREAHNTRFHGGGGGSPKSKNIWNNFQAQRKLRGAKGKYILNKLGDKLKIGNKLSSDNIEKHSFKSNIELATDLKEILSKLCK